ncbi:MAG: gliding motility-associated protein GldE [Bacteroidetes bacterium]|nr:gliding motility-associated protein GldE [Bacteroidota bacterium]MBL0018595.1 gliding motility-associated protein GldE [Bacteroidota bacterium]MBP6720909.1 gliding motility-associated protein GldE [Bacteroidia bacterium]
MDTDPNSTVPVVSNLSLYFSNEWPMLVLMLLLMVLSGLAAMAEVAFFSLPQNELGDYKEANGLVWRLLQKPRRLLATILVFGNLVNVGFIFVAVMEIQDLFDHTAWADKPWLPWVVYPLDVVFISFMILLFGEITPKIYASQRRVQLVNLLAYPIAFFRFILSPVATLLVSTTNFWERRIKTHGGAASFEDIKHAIDLTSEEESPDEEKEILKGIVDFGNTMVKSIMRSRVDMVAIEETSSLEELLELVNLQGYSRMPVFEGNLDNVTGTLYVKDLIPLLKEDRPTVDWKTLIRPAYFIPETKKIDSLLDDFKTRRLHIAIVVDEFGGTSGLVTLEDIVEEIFGDIADEFDDVEVVLSKVSETEYILDGKIPLDDLIATLELPENVLDDVRGTADTLAGLILELHRKIPDQGDEIEHAQFHFTVESVEQNRIKRLRLVLVPLSDGDDIENEVE